MVDQSPPCPSDEDTRIVQCLSGPPALPVEIFTLIAEHLASPNDVYSLGMTCSSAAAACRKLLGSHIELASWNARQRLRRSHGSSADKRALVKKLVVTERYGTQSDERWTARAGDASLLWAMCGLPNCEELRVWSQMSDWDRSAWYDNDECFIPFELQTKTEWNFFPKLPGEMLRELFPNLRKIDLHYDRPSFLHRGARADPALEGLGLLTVFHQCPSLRECTLRYFTDPKYHQNDGSDRMMTLASRVVRQSLPALESLELVNCWFSEHVFCKLLETRPAKKLIYDSNLIVRHKMVRFIDLTNLRTALGRTRDQLEQLDVCLAAQATDVYPIDLSTYPLLKDLCINFKTITGKQGIIGARLIDESFWSLPVVLENLIVLYDVKDSVNHAKSWLLRLLELRATYLPRLKRVVMRRLGNIIWSFENELFDAYCAAGVKLVIGSARAKQRRYDWLDRE